MLTTLGIENRAWSNSEGIDSRMTSAVTFDVARSRVNFQSFGADVVPPATTRAEESSTRLIASNETSEMSSESPICFQDWLWRLIRMRRAIPFVTGAAMTCFSESGAYVRLHSVSVKRLNKELP